MDEISILDELMSLSADEFGKEVLRQSDRSQRDTAVWEVITSEDVIYQARDALRHMKGVNELARQRRREELENARVEYLDGSGVESRTWQKLKAEHAAWQLRAGRFANRVNMALREIKATLRDRLEGTPEGHLQDLLSAVLAHRGGVLADDYEPTRHDTLLWKIAEDIADRIDWVRGQ